MATASRSKPNPNALAELLSSALPPLAKEAAAEQIAEAESHLQHARQRSALWHTELKEVEQLHEVLLSRLPTRVRAPVATERRRAPGAPPPYSEVRAEPSLAPRPPRAIAAALPEKPTLMCFPPEAPSDSATSAAAVAPRYTGTAFGSQSARGGPPPATPWRPAGVQAGAPALTERGHLSGGKQMYAHLPPGWHEEAPEEDGAAHELPPVTGRRKRLTRERGGVGIGTDRGVRTEPSKWRPVSREVDVDSMPVIVPAAGAPAASTGPSADRPPTTSTLRAQMLPHSTSAIPRPANLTPSAGARSTSSPRQANLPMPPSLAPPSTPGPPPIPTNALPSVPPLNPPAPAHSTQNPLLSPPSPGVLRWARDQEANEALLPRATAIPPASDITERSVVERMQRRLLAARRYAMSQHAMDGAAGVDLGALGQQSKGGSALAYPALVYASYNPACPPEGRGGKPGNTSTPRRLLSNRWNSAVQYRTCDLRIADTGTIGRSDVLAGISGSGAPRFAEALASRSTGTDMDEDASAAGVAGLLLNVPFASPAAARVAYHAQLVADAVLPYERASRWTVGGAA